MKQKLESLGRLSWLDSDFADLSDPSHFENDPYERYLRLKRGNQLSRRGLGAAREVAAWREITAAKRNLPRKWLLTDEQIVEACRREAKTIDDLYMIRGIRGHIQTKDARKICELINRGLSLPEDELPKLTAPSATELNVDSAVDLMEALVRVRAKESGIAMQTLATRAQLTELARGHYDATVVMKGWRRQLIGDELLALLDGKISLSILNNELVIKS
jgi:ribonuclease D